ncbi:MAG: DoxX family protein [Gemmatimonadota bacterium]|jgi:uncharacterized membrane protein YphA (DoxX/SURF4 family)|nr:MAG: DoxX family protein [Gemmatimonadota bacterium]
MTALFWIGRILFSMLFIASGLNHFTQRQAMTAYAEAKGLAAAGTLVPLTGLMLLAGGLSILFWTWVDVGAWLLALFLFTAAIRMHAFWKEEDPAVRQVEMAQFMKNVALAGASIVFYVLYQWPELAI